MGGYLMFDQSYPSVQTTLNINYAYHIPLNYDNINLPELINKDKLYTYKVIWL